MVLTALEQHVLLAVLRQHPLAYGISIQDEMKHRTGREMSFGSIYACLERLKEKGFVESRLGEPTRQRGGKAKMYFVLTAPGHKTLQASLSGLGFKGAGGLQEVRDVI